MLIYLRVIYIYIYVLIIYMCIIYICIIYIYQDLKGRPKATKTATFQSFFRLPEAAIVMLKPLRP
jgi:hypothetical protein